MTKRNIVLVAAIVTLLLLVAAQCATPVVVQQPQVVEKVVTKEVEVVKEVEKERPTVNMWVDHFFFVKGAEALLKSYVLEYAQQEGYNVEYVQDSYDIMRPRVAAALEAGTLPDVLFTAVDVMAAIRRADNAMDVTDVVTDLNQNMGGISEGMLAGITVEGKYWGVPLFTSSEMFYTRQDLLNEVGMEPPATWEEVIEVARAVNDPPVIWGWGPQVSAGAYDTERARSSMLWSYGASVFSEDGQSITIDSPETRQVLEMMKMAWDEGLIPQEAITWDDSSNNKAYQSGLTAMILNTGSVVAWMAENDPELLKNTALTAIPAGPEGRFVQGDMWGLVLPNSTDHPEFVKGLARYISEPERYQALIEEMGGLRLPVYKDLAKMEMWADPALAPLAESIPYTYLPGYPGPVTDASLQAFQQLVVARMFTRVLADDWPLDEAINEAVNTLETIMAETGL